MSTITFSGLASGLDTSSWVDALVSAKQTTVTSMQAKLSTIEAKQATFTTLQTSFNTLRTKIEAITDSKFGGSFDIFANNTATSSNTSVFTASATSSASRQAYNISVEQLATNTTAQSDHSTSAVADNDTTLSSLGVTAGTVSVYVNGVKNTVTLSTTQTVSDLKSAFSAIGVNANVDSNGKLNLASSNPSDKVLVGASNDTSNFKSLFGLTQQTDGSYQSSSALYKVSTSSKLTTSNLFTTGKKDADGNPINTTITAGSFVIGDATITIDDNTTIAGLVSKINSSTKAGATAYWDTANSKLVLTSKNEGSSYVNVEAGTSNLTDVLGLTTSTWNTDGSVASTSLNTDSQTLGKNAKLTVNGTSIVSSSNTVSSAVSKLAGVTLTLKGTSSTSSSTSSSSTSTTLTIGQDTSSIVTAVKDFVTQYNSVLKDIDTDTASNGKLYGESSLIDIKKSLRQYSTASDANNGVYSLLSQIGISTAKVGASLSDDTQSLTIDEDKLTSALESNSDAVKSLLVGSSSSNSDGLLSKMGTLVSNSMGSSGYFSTAAATFKSQVTDMNTKISKETAVVTKYKATLEAKFSAMETAVSKMQSNYSSYLNSSSSKSS